MAVDAEDRLVLAGPISRSGRYARQGRQAAAGLEQAVADATRAGGVRLGDRRVRPHLVLLDDASSRAGVRRALDAVARADLLFGPYGSNLVAEAAEWAAERGRVLWNHGGTADDVERHPSVVSVPSPASRYMGAVLAAAASVTPVARVVVAVRPGAFGRALADGARETATRLGLGEPAVVTPQEVSEALDTDLLLTGGSFDDDVALLRRLRRPPRLVGAVAAGLGAFAGELGPRVEGVLGPSQWEEGVRFHPDVGPTAAHVVRALRARLVPTLSVGAASAHVDYVSAQAYATTLVALRSAEEASGPDDAALLAAARRLRGTTFFGRYGLGTDGRQDDHGVLVVQWQAGMKRVVWPPDQAEAPLVA